MPLQRRLPKIGFVSRVKKYTTEVRLGELNSLPSEIIDLKILKEFNVVPSFVKVVKIIKSGELKKIIIVKGIKVTEGAKQSILAIGGKVEL
jgi:large subunit ribosomal protein L15